MYEVATKLNELLLLHNEREREERNRLHRRRREKVRDTGAYLRIIWIFTCKATASNVGYASHNAMFDDIAEVLFHVCIGGFVFSVQRTWGETSSQLCIACIL